METLRPFRILCICTGNICRSPVAERMLRTALDGPVEVASAGTHAVVGSPIHPLMVDLLKADHISPDGFRARAVTEQMLTESDLVLTLSREHRTAIVEMAPAVVRRAFTLTEFAALLPQAEGTASTTGLHGAELKGIVRRATTARSALRLTEDHLDVEDPIGRPQEEFVAAYAKIRAAVDVIGRSLTMGPEGKK